jgi:hypothetical protein
MSASARCCSWVACRLRTPARIAPLGILSTHVDLHEKMHPLPTARLMDVDQGWPVMQALVMAIVAAWLVIRCEYQQMDAPEAIPDAVASS